MPRRRRRSGFPGAHVDESTEELAQQDWAPQQLTADRQFSEITQQQQPQLFGQQLAAGRQLVEITQQLEGNAPQLFGQQLTAGEGAQLSASQEGVDSRQGEGSDKIRHTSC